MASCKQRKKWPLWLFLRVSSFMLTILLSLTWCSAHKSLCDRVTGCAVSESRKDACSDGLFFFFLDVLPRLLEKFDRASHQRAGGWLWNYVVPWKPCLLVPLLFFFLWLWPISYTSHHWDSISDKSSFGRKGLFCHKGKGYRLTRWEATAEEARDSWSHCIGQEAERMLLLPALIQGKIPVHRCHCLLLGLVFPPRSNPDNPLQAGRQGACLSVCWF